MVFKRIKVRKYEVGLYFRDGEFRGLLDVGRYWFFDPLRRVQVDVVSQRTPWLVHDKLDVIDDRGDATFLIADDIRGVRKTVQIKLMKDHGLSVTIRAL